MIVFQLYITYFLLSVLAAGGLGIADQITNGAYPWIATAGFIAIAGPVLSLLAIFVVGALAVIWSPR